MNKIQERADELAQQMEDIEFKAVTEYTLADAIRDGSTVSEHNPRGWGNGETACALTAGVIGFVARGYLEVE